MNVTVTLSDMRLINLLIPVHSFHTIIVGTMKGLWIYSLSMWIPCPPCIESTRRHPHKACAQALCVGSTWWLQLHMPSKGFLPWTEHNEWTSKCCFTVCIPVFHNEPARSCKILKANRPHWTLNFACSDGQWAGWLGRQRIVLFASTSSLAVGPAQPPVQ